MSWHSICLWESFSKVLFFAAALRSAALGKPWTSLYPRRLLCKCPGARSLAEQPSNVWCGQSTRPGVRWRCAHSGPPVLLKRCQRCIFWAASAAHRACAMQHPTWSPCETEGLEATFSAVSSHPSSSLV